MYYDNAFYDNFDNVYDNEINDVYDNESVVNFNTLRKSNMINRAILFRQNIEKRVNEEKKKKENMEKEKIEKMEFKTVVSPMLNWVKNPHHHTQPDVSFSSDFPSLSATSFTKNDSFNWIHVKQKEKIIQKSENLYEKTKICTLIKEGRGCPRKDKCTYAHSRSELKIVNCPYDYCKFVRIYNSKYQNTHKHYVCDRRHRNETDANFFFRTKIYDPVTEKEMQDAYDEFEYNYSHLTTTMKKYINELPCDKVVVFNGFKYNGNAMATYKQHKIQQKLKEKEKIVEVKVWANFMDTIKKSEPSEVKPEKNTTTAWNNKVKENKSTEWNKEKESKSTAWKNEVKEKVVDISTVWNEVKEKVVDVSTGWIEVKSKEKKVNEKIILRSQICRSVSKNIKCPYNEKCSYAHTKRELTVTNCGFDIDCILIKIVSGKYMNINTKKTCCYIHPSESKSNFYSRNNLN